MTPPLLESDRAWFAATNAARRARTPRTRPRSSTRSRATSADRPKLVISFGEAHLALPRSCTGRDRAFSGTNHEAVTIRAAPRGGPRPQAGKAISAAGAPGFSPHQVAHHNDNPSPRSQAERHRGPADDRGMPVDQLHGSPLSKSLPALFGQPARASGAPNASRNLFHSLSPCSTGWPWHKRHQVLRRKRPTAQQRRSLASVGGLVWHRPRRINPHLPQEIV